MTSRITVPRQVPTALDVYLAVQRIAPYLRRTPLLRTSLRGRPLLLKLEHLQLTGAFKLRGALNALLAKNKDERVVTASGGNHGLGVATAARLLGVTATVYVPETVPEIKERRLRDAGAEVVRAGHRVRGSRSRSPGVRGSRRDPLHPRLQRPRRGRRPGHPRLRDRHRRTRL